jgi:hypothetical protein
MSPLVHRGVRRSVKPMQHGSQMRALGPNVVQSYRSRTMAPRPRLAWVWDYRAACGAARVVGSARGTGGGTGSHLGCVGMSVPCKAQQ